MRSMVRGQFHVNDILSSKELECSDIYSSQARVTNFDCVAHILECVRDGLKVEDEVHGSQLFFCVYEHLGPQHPFEVSNVDETEVRSNAPFICKENRETKPCFA